METITKASEYGLFQISGGHVGGTAENILAGIPKGLQTKATDELEAKANKEAAAVQFAQIADGATQKLSDNSWRAQSAIPGTTAYKERVEMNAVIHQRMTGRGLASENDADKAITPFFISPLDSPQDAQRKMVNATASGCAQPDADPGSLRARRRALRRGSGLRARRSAEAAGKVRSHGEPEVHSDRLEGTEVRGR